MMQNESTPKAEFVERQIWENPDGLRMTIISIQDGIVHYLTDEKEVGRQSLERLQKWKKNGVITLINDPDPRLGSGWQDLTERYNQHLAENDYSAMNNAERLLFHCHLDWLAKEMILKPLPSAADQDIETFLADVRTELLRARTKFPGDRIMTIALAEEFGELCKAVLDEPAASVRKEAVQCAVMAARVVLDGDGSVKEWRQERGLDSLVGGSL